MFDVLVQAADELGESRQLCCHLTAIPPDDHNALEMLIVIACIGQPTVI